MANILEFSQENKNKIFIACTILQEVIDSSGHESIYTRLEDLKNDSLITLNYYNNKDFKTVAERQKLSDFGLHKHLMEEVGRVESIGYCDRITFKEWVDNL
jgi:hypothetical protein